jgi:glycosyltransferase involved in cell wall biosynthesis
MEQSGTAAHDTASASDVGRLPHLLLCGWHSEGTGFTRVLRALLPHLTRYFRVTWIGVGYRGAPQQLGPNLRLLPTNLQGGDLVGAYAMRLNWNELAADAVLALNDVWYLEHYARELREVLGPVPMLGYLPLDGDIPDPRLVEGLRGFSALCTYTNHAAAELGAALQACGLQIPVSVAGHGVDLSSFSPQPSVRSAGFAAALRMQLAQRLFGLEEPAWVVLNASRPDPRKRIDISIEGFARFARDLPGHVRLCLHQAIAHPQFAEPLRHQAEALGIGDRMLWWPPRAGALDDAGLNALYNACAVGLNTSHGEGFGLVSFEHAATGAPQLLPDHAALRELWGDAAMRLAVRPLMTPHSPLRMGEVDASAVATGLTALYRNQATYVKLARAGITRCAADDLRWESAAQSLLGGLRVATAQSAPL